jgi:hypothetical protein
VEVRSAGSGGLAMPSHWQTSSTEITTGSAILDAAIHAITLVDIIHRNYYRLGDLGRSICLGRWNARNLLWNLYVFCSVAFLEMDASGFQQHYPIFSHVCSVLQAAVY